VAEEGLHIPEYAFYIRMDELTGNRKWRDSAAMCAEGIRLYAETYLNYDEPPVWAKMRDREAQARIDAQPSYDKFRKGLQLEYVPQAPPGNTVPSNEPAEDDEVL
jgi:hypothetical protein